MKNVNALIIATVMALTTATVTAGEISSGGSFVENRTTKVFETNAVASKDLAYQIGFSELKRILSGAQSNNGAHINGAAYVSVSERMNINGQIEYVGRAVVPLHSQETDSDK